MNIPCCKLWTASLVGLILAFSPLAGDAQSRILRDFEFTRYSCNNYDFKKPKVSVHERDRFDSVRIHIDHGTIWWDGAERETDSMLYVTYYRDGRERTSEFPLTTWQNKRDEKRARKEARNSSEAGATNTQAGTQPETQPATQADTADGTSDTTEATIILDIPDSKIHPLDIFQAMEDGAQVRKTVINGRTHRIYTLITWSCHDPFCGSKHGHIQVKMEQVYSDRYGLLVDAQTNAPLFDEPPGYMRVLTRVGKDRDFDALMSDVIAHEIRHAVLRKYIRTDRPDLR